MTNIRVCFRCNEHRPESEIFCGNCQANMSQISPISIEQLETSLENNSPQLSTERTCLNSHPMEPDDVFCLKCGKTAEDSYETLLGEETECESIDGWSIIKQLPGGTEHVDKYLVESSGKRGVLFYFKNTDKVNTEKYDILEKISSGKFQKVLAYGTWNNGSYEIVDLITNDCLSTPNVLENDNLEHFREIIIQIGEMIHALNSHDIYHCNIKPENIFLANHDPIKIILGGMQNSRKVNFELESPLLTYESFYMAPEVVAGGVSSASDWWSLGILILHFLTNGKYFEGFNTKAFRIRVATRALDIPSNIEPSFRTLLRGLLIQNPEQRWKWKQVQAWRDGSPVEVPPESNIARETKGPSITVNEKKIYCPSEYALIAAEPDNWECCKDLLLRGNVTLWLEKKDVGNKKIAMIRNIISSNSINDDEKHALALMVLNYDLPPNLRGDVIEQGWLINYPIRGYELITSKFMFFLHQLRPGSELCNLPSRIHEVRHYAKILEIDIDEYSFQTCSLLISVKLLQNAWEKKRYNYPDSDHKGLNSLIERKVYTEVDLIILLSAKLEFFQSREQIIAKAQHISDTMNVTLNIEQVELLLSQTRNDIYNNLTDHICNFRYCGHESLDLWANDFRTENRIALHKALVLLSIPPQDWIEPPRQQYIANLLEYFQDRIKRSTLNCKPLNRLLIGNSKTNIDLAFIEGENTSPTFLLEHIINRNHQPIKIESNVLKSNPSLAKKLQNLQKFSKLRSREVGIDSLFLGFPFFIYNTNANSKSSKLKIMPILLWPIKIDVKGKDHISISFDKERNEVYLNPVFSSLFTSNEVTTWEKIKNDILGRAILKPEDIVNAFSILGEPKNIELCKHPDSQYSPECNPSEIFCSAVLFYFTFYGQSIKQDLSKLLRMNIVNTCLEYSFRLDSKTEEPKTLLNEKEHERFYTIKSDPSQEIAAKLARQSHGVLIEGPPGTGKSQTLVNIISNCIGHKKSVLVICQKAAALEVIGKRLDKVGLNQRYVYIPDENKNRTQVLKDLRLQLNGFLNTYSQNLVNELIKERNDLATNIEIIENEINKYHDSYHDRDEYSGFDYRTILGKLLEIEENPIVKIISIPSLRNALGKLTKEKFLTVKDQCSNLASIWLASSYENSPYIVLSSVTPDKSLIEDLEANLLKFNKAEQRRVLNLDSYHNVFEISDPKIHQTWLKEDGEFLGSTPWDKISKWFYLFSQPHDETGDKFINKVKNILLRLDSIIPSHFDDLFSVPLSFIPSKNLKKLHKTAIKITGASSFFKYIDIFKWIGIRRIKRFISDLNDIPTLDRILEFSLAVKLEFELRPLRDTLSTLLQKLYGKDRNDNPIFFNEVKNTSTILLNDLNLTKKTVSTIQRCPLPEKREVMFIHGEDAYKTLIAQYKEAFDQYEHRVNSFTHLKKIEPYLSDEVYSTFHKNISSKLSSISMLKDLIDALPTLGPYLQFKFRENELLEESLTILSIIREYELELKPYKPQELQILIEYIMNREWLLYIKEMLEKKHLLLRTSKKELTKKIDMLKTYNEDMMCINQKLLATNYDMSIISTSRTEWEDITRLSGQRALRLREFTNRGIELGLMGLRPVWLMNPYTASRVLPLIPGMFDFVIFDEASQIPVENAIPALCRAKKAIISGDSQQMPPSNYFGRNIEDDDEGLEELNSDFAVESEMVAYKEACDRREIKDCPDLLALGKTFLDSSMLQIHYRSKYKELIDFSNAAFYQNNLHIPVHHPDSFVLEKLPIEVVNVNGLYDERMNKSEAEKVADILEQLWSSSVNLSIGVVTFNRVQAELIEDTLELRSEINVKFFNHLSAAREFRESGEDKSFFVKNVENIQGDERDIIIFSTTFGRNTDGKFIRNFGPLSKADGYRRLNVAITRAKEKVILVTSMPLHEISNYLRTNETPQTSGDYLQAYFDYASKISSTQLKAAKSSLMKISSNLKQLESAGGYIAGKDGFVNSVGRYIESLGLNPIRNNSKEDLFGLDFVIEDRTHSRFEVGIECDASFHPILEKARTREIWRQEVLKLGIRKIHRVSSFEWYHNRESEAGQLKKLLQDCQLIHSHKNISNLIEEVES